VTGSGGVNDHLVKKGIQIFGPPYSINGPSSYQHASKQDCQAVYKTGQNEKRLQADVVNVVLRMRYRIVKNLNVESKSCTREEELNSDLQR